jgi:diguanylate cyclase (GGDEF)-like protein/PAS domain S-box-containing protein
VSENVTDVIVDYAQLYDDAPCGYLLTNDDGTIVAVNDTFVSWTGHTRATLLGTRVQKLMPIGDQILYSTHCIPQLAIGGAVAEIAIEVIAAGGQRRAALLSATRTPGTADRSAQVKVIIFSAHERRRYEKELVAARRRAEESEARRASAEADLHHLAWHDSLTGLLNRAGLTAHLATLTGTHDQGADHGAELPAAYPPQRGVLFIDLDHFKEVNDSLGHAAGDELLTVVAARLQNAVRQGATLARLSGDEFVVVDTFGTGEEAAALAERLLEALNAPLVIEGLEIVVSASIGAAVAHTAEDTFERLVRHADIAMYRAKARGRNSWQLHDVAHADPAVDRLRLLGELRHGIERGELRLHYQPRMDLGTDRLAGVEALVRWQHPARGLLPPAAFIEIAEDSGLVRELGAWVLDAAIEQAVQWHYAGLGGAGIEMAVNLSARQLADPRLIDRITDALIRHGLQPSLLVLEITETALMVDPDAALATLHALKSLGVGLAIDDFGTGYSSFSYLKAFPVDELKIDRSFVAGLGTDTGDSAIVASCVQLAHAVGLRAVAEGVETPAQRQALIDLGCDLGQGYHWSAPLPADQLPAWLAGRSHPTELTGPLDATSAAD